MERRGEAGVSGLRPTFRFRISKSQKTLRVGNVMITDDIINVQCRQSNHSCSVRYIRDVGTSAEKNATTGYLGNNRIYCDQQPQDLTLSTVESNSLSSSEI